MGESQQETLLEIDEGSGIPIWVQLRNRLVFLIESGHYQPGDQMPTVRALAAQLGINYHTCNKVYTTLEYEGYITSKRGRGAFVNERENGDSGATAADAIMEECVRRCLEQGMTLQDIRKRFLAILERRE